jgi:hypothetical protein
MSLLARIKRALSGVPNPADAEPPPRRERREAGRERNHETGEPAGRRQAQSRRGTRDLRRDVTPHADRALRPDRGDVSRWTSDVAGHMPMRQGLLLRANSSDQNRSPDLNHGTGPSVSE